MLRLHRLLLPCLAGLLLAAPSVSQEIDPAALPVRTDLAARLKRHVEALASPELRGRQPGTEGNRAAARYLVARFQDYGLRALPSLGGFRQPITDDLGDNLIALRPARQPAASTPWILVGAHYDHLGDNFLGADDNASGVAILLETARLLDGLERHGVLFAAFNTEERPYVRTPLMGSQHFVDHLPPEVGAPQHLRVAIIMDLMGGVYWEPLRQVVFAAGAEKSPELDRRLKTSIASSASLAPVASGHGRRETGNGKRKTLALSAMPAQAGIQLLAERLDSRLRGHDGIESEGGQGTAMDRRDDARDATDATEVFADDLGTVRVIPLGIHLVEELPLFGRTPFSDYDAFRDAAVPFVFLSSGRTPRYHTSADLPGTLHYERMAATVRWLLAWLEAIDRDPRPYRFEPDRLAFADEVAALRPLVARAATWESRIPSTSILSYWRLQRDATWLRSLDPTDPNEGAVSRVERISLRIQCLLVDFVGCFLL